MPDALTFLFTDIEGSTRLWERHPRGHARLARAPRRHPQGCRGPTPAVRVVKTTGDGVMAVFAKPSGSEGVNTCAWRRSSGLVAEPWTGTGPLRVRMGSTWARPSQRDGDYFGPAGQSGRADHGRGPRRPGPAVGVAASLVGEVAARRRAACATSASTV